MGQEEEADEDLRMEDLRRRMEAIGVPAEIFDVYVELCRRGICKASDVAQALQINRPDAYRRLDRLTEDGFASKLLSRPARYAAAAPETLFQILEQRQQQELGRIQRAQTEMLGALKRIHGEEADATPRNTFRIVQGRKAIYDQVAIWTDEAKARIRVVTTHPHAAAFAGGSGIWERMFRRHQEGIPFQVVLADSPVTRDYLGRTPSDMKECFRFARRDAMIRFLIFDDDRLVILASIDPSSKQNSDRDVAILTEAPGFIQQQSLLFEFMWEEAVTLEEVLGTHNRP